MNVVHWVEYHQSVTRARTVGPLLVAAFYVSLLHKGRVARDMRQAKISMTNSGWRNILVAHCDIAAHAESHKSYRILRAHGCDY